MQNIKISNLIMDLRRTFVVPVILAVVMIFAYSLGISCIKWTPIGTQGVVTAADNESLPILDRNSGSINVTFQGVPDSVPVPGGKVHVVKVADFRVNSDGFGIYNPVGEFKALGTKYENMTASESIVAAQEMYELVQSKGIATQMKVTDSNGEAAFNNLEVGMYLIYVEEEVAVGNNKYYFKPFLAQMPAVIVDGDNKVTGWEYNAIAAPKVQSNVPIPEEPETPPYNPVPPGNLVRTGDMNRIYMWIGLSIVSVMSMGWLVFIHNRRQETNK